MSLIRLKMRNVTKDFGFFCFFCNISNMFKKSKYIIPKMKVDIM